MNQPQTFNEACHLVASEIAEFVIGKQHDYGHQNILDFGELGILVRVNDKVARLKNLVDKEAVNESKTDSWRDIGGYSIVELMRERGWFTLELEE